MKTKLLFLLPWLCRSAFAAVTVSAPTTYTQNFNTLPSAASPVVTWNNNVTIPGWYLFRDGATPPTPTVVVSNGSGAWVANLYSLGAAGNADRALGSCPTTAHGAYSFNVIFQNTSAGPLKVSRVKFNVEVYRTNSVITTQTETLAFSRRFAATEAEIANALAGPWVTDTSLDYVYPAQAVASQVRPPDVATVNKAPGADVTVLPGQFLSLRWTNANDGGEDAYMGIDDVEVQFESPPCTISAAASSIVRNQNGTPADPNDDTLDFSLLVTGFGTGASGWKTTNANIPVVTGSYGTAKTITGVPVASTPLTLTLADATISTCTTSVTVSAPVTDLAVTSTNSVSVTFTAPPLLAQSYVRTGNSTEPGWTGGTAAARVQAQPAPNTTAKYFDINLARPTFTTEGVNISAVNQFRASIDLAAYTTSDTTLEDPDTLTVQVQTSPVATGGTWTTVATLLDATTVGTTLFGKIKVSDPGIAFAAGNYPAADFPFVTFRSNVIPRSPTANYARMLVSGGNDSASEHTLLDNITFSPVTCTVNAPYTLSRNNNGDDDPSNDTFTVTAKVTAELNGGNQFWSSNSTPPNGFYSADIPVVFGPFFVSAGPQDIVISDTATADCKTTIRAIPPPTSLATDVVNVGRQEKGTVTLNDDSITLDLTVTATNGGSGWTSNIPIPNDPEHVYSGTYGDFIHIVADVATMPLNPLIMDRADPTATVPLTSALPSPTTYVIGDVLLIGSAPALLPSAPGISPKNVWKNLTNGVVTQNDGSKAINEFGDLQSDLITINSDPIIFRENSGAVQVTAELSASETGPNSNFEADDIFQAKIWWLKGGELFSKNLIDPFDSNGNDFMNGYNDTAALPYNSNKLLDEFNRPSPGLATSGSITATFQLSGTIPAGSEAAGIDIIGMNNSTEERFVLKNLRFAETGANPSSDNDGDGVSNADEDIMGTDKSDPSSVLRLTQKTDDPTQFTFTGVPGRFYRIYRSDDAAESTHLTKWVDAGLPTLKDFGPHTVQVTVQPGEARRYYRVHVKQTDGPWPATVP
jgi:hypothetical protein